MSLPDTIFSEKPTGSWLYHYTSKSGLLGIFGSGAVWATSIHYMNDSKEFRHAMEMVNISLRELNGVGDADRISLTTILTEQLESIRKIYMFVFSLSEKSDLLSQWRGYSETGGFAIEFEWEKLVSIAAISGFQLGRCLYDYKEQQKAITPLVECAKNIYLEGVKENLNPEVISKKISTEFLGKFISISPFLKHHAFSEEKEWRLVSRPTDMDSPQVRYREGTSMLIPYFDLNIQGLDQDFPVSGIVVGPCPHPELSANAACNFVTKKGKFRQFSVRHSTVPYREW